MVGAKFDIRNREKEFLILGFVIKKGKTSFQEIRDFFEGYGIGLVDDDVERLISEDCLEALNIEGKSGSIKKMVVLPRPKGVALWLNERFRIGLDPHTCLPIGITQEEMSRLVENFFIHWEDIPSIYFILLENGLVDIANFSIQVACTFIDYYSEDDRSLVFDLADIVLAFLILPEILRKSEYATYSGLLEEECLRRVDNKRTRIVELLIKEYELRERIEELVEENFNKLIVAKAELDSIREILERKYPEG